MSKEKKGKDKSIINRNGLISYDGTCLSLSSEEENQKEIRFDPIDPDFGVKVYEKDRLDKISQREPTADETLDLLIAAQENYPNYVFMDHLEQITTRFVEAEANRLEQQAAKLRSFLTTLTEKNNE